MRIGITGSAGFIGWHLRCLLVTRPEIEFREADRTTMADPEQLRTFAADVDAIVHLAGANRAPTEEEIVNGNLSPARDLIAACEEVDAIPRIVFANSTHAERELPTAYGRAKAACAERFREWAAGGGGAFVDLMIPHVFGEHGRPFYNSAVATFCHQLAEGIEPTVDDPDSPLELVHAQDLAERLLDAAEHAPEGRTRLEGEPITVGQVAERLRRMRRIHDNGDVPDLTEPFAARLFNTLRSFDGPARVRDATSFEARAGARCAVETLPPRTRSASHFHRFTFERIFMVGGRGRVRMRRLNTEEAVDLHVEGSGPHVVDIPTLHAREIENTGNRPMAMLSLSYPLSGDPLSDTYPHGV